MFEGGKEGGYDGCVYLVCCLIDFFEGSSV